MASQFFYRNRPVRPGEASPITAEDERAIQDFGRRFLRSVEDVEREGVTYVLRLPLDSIETVPEQAEREEIWKIANVWGSMRAPITSWRADCCSSLTSRSGR